MQRAGKPSGHRDNRHPALVNELMGIDPAIILPVIINEWDLINKQMEKKLPKRRRGRVDEEEEKNDEEG